ncbi:MAG: hypothetical protein QM500_09145 [Methylococcales bacterium]
MAIYRIRANHENFMVFSLKVEELYAKMGDDFLYHIDRTPVKQENWKAPTVTFRKPSDFKNANAIPDIADWVNSHLVFSQKAYDALSSQLESYGEFLPVICEGITYYIFNVLKLVDDSFIDLDKSEREMEDGIQVGLHKLKFKEDLLKDTLLFKAEYDTYLNIFCGDVFKEIVEEAGLKGIEFKPDLASVF